MKAQQIALVQESWRLLVPIAEPAAQTFYNRLFELDPSLRALFKNDMGNQGRKLMQTLGLAVKGLTNLHQLMPVLQELGHRHLAYGVSDESYNTVGSALLWTLEQHFGPAFTSDLRASWTEAYSLVATAMKQASHDRIAVIAQLAATTGFIEPGQEAEFVQFCRKAQMIDPTKTPEDFGVEGGFFTVNQSKRLRQAATASTYTCTSCGWNGLGRLLIIVKNTIMCRVCGRPTIALRIAAQPPTPQPATPHTPTPPLGAPATTVYQPTATPTAVPPPLPPVPSEMPTTLPPSVPAAESAGAPLLLPPDLRNMMMVPPTVTPPTVLELNSVGDSVAELPKLDDLKPGIIVGDCRIEARIGEGGMGFVYRAEDVHLGRKVAIKFLGPDWLRSASQIARFEQEARVLARLEHPNIVPVYRMGRLDGWPYLILQWIEGESLGSRIKRFRGPLLIPEAVDLLIQTARGLAAAHIEGVIHRDVKPDNILVTRHGVAKVADFGLAKQQEGDMKLSRTGALLGTPAYASPEQMGGRPVDGRTDVYSLGITAYHMLAGELPFLGETVVQVLMKHESAPLPDLRVVNPAVSPELADLVSRMCAKSPDDRPDTMATVVLSLSALQSAR